MRSFGDIKSRWNTIFDNAIGVNLRQAIREDQHPDPCEDGLRSVCWKAFLLYGPLSKASWTKKMAESRNGYDSLRTHFLRYIDHPNDLQSAEDPLADDERSPWSTLRQDEVNREEIYQDVTRCMQENYFFREPATQKIMLDILFIYSKLNPDTGYRQGMHELLAPIIWVVHQDALSEVADSVNTEEVESLQFALDILDNAYIDHDAFSLFCALMQTAKGMYELGDDRDSSMIITQSRKIHDDLLARIDPELALHLQVIGILPQIYSIRWIRLLFGREFEFKDLLCIWDVLFTENIRLELINITCVVMLLRVRWSLITADYTSAIIALTRYDAKNVSKDPRSLVKDALYLEKNQNAEAGGTLIHKYSGRRPASIDDGEQARKGQIGLARNVHLDIKQQRLKTTEPSTRLAPPQKPLENLFQEISGGISRRAEGWNVSKAVKGAMDEVKRNVNNFQSVNPRLGVPSAKTEYQVSRSKQSAETNIRILEEKLSELQARNKALAVMLDSALEELRSDGLPDAEKLKSEKVNFNMSVAKIQFVSVYLSDPDIPIPRNDPWPNTFLPSQEPEAARSEESLIQDSSAEQTKRDLRTNVSSTEENHRKVEPPDVEGSERQLQAVSKDKPQDNKPRHNIRPSLAESSFSFMLGENRHRSSFVSSVSELPEARRDSDPKIRPKQLWADGQQKPDKKASVSEEGGFTLNKLHGTERS